MLLWTSLLCLLSAHLAVSQFAKPEILADYDPATVLKPTNNNLGDKDSSSSRHLIRGLLMARQTGCPVGYDECADPASGRCCPTGSSCCEGDGCCSADSFCYFSGCCPNGDSGCEGNSCCSPGQSCCAGGGCCDPGFFCDVVDGITGCCPNGEVCTGPPQCSVPGYDICPTGDFCCPPGYECFHDSTGAPECRFPTSGVPPSLTDTNSPTVTPVQPTPTGLQGPATVLFSGTTDPSSKPLPATGTVRSPSPSPTSNSNSNSNTNTNTNGSGAVGSALSVGVNVLLVLFAGVGAFAFLF